MTTPRVSVLLTTYNRERYVASAIRSVLAQTFTDYELIISDNQSTDRTVEIARDFAARDPRIRVSVNERNLGQFGNRNRAADLACAPLLKYHDSDDLMYPHCLATMVSMIDAVPEAGFGLSSGTAWPGGPCPMVLTPRMAYQREYLGSGTFMCGPSGAIFRAETFRLLGGFEDRGAPSDYVFWLRACRRVTIALLPADLFWYRMHPGQEFASGRAAREYAEMAGEAWRALDAPDCPLTLEECEQARRNRAYHVLKRTVEDLRRGRWAGASHRLRHCGMRPADWVRYLRVPQRSEIAGTPLDSNGEFEAPPWLG